MVLERFYALPREIGLNLIMRDKKPEEVHSVKKCDIPALSYRAALEAFNKAVPGWQGNYSSD